MTMALLHEKNDSRSVEPIIGVLINERHYSGRVYATWLLGWIGERQAVLPLIDALHDEDANVRRGAAEGLGQIGDQQAIEPLKNRLNDESRYVSEAAAEALRKLGHDPDANE
jgi:HEAT repeat protein